MFNRPTKESALSAYAVAVAEMRETLAALLAHADDHLGVAPEDVHWGHVGSANHVNEQLAEIAVFLGLREEETGMHGKVRRGDGSEVRVYIPSKADDEDD